MSEKPVTIEELKAAKDYYQSIIDDYIEYGASDASKIAGAWEKLKAIKKAIDLRAEEILHLSQKCSA